MVELGWDFFSGSVVGEQFVFHKGIFVWQALGGFGACVVWSVSHRGD